MLNYSVAELRLNTFGCSVYYIGNRRNKVLKQFCCLRNLYRLLVANRYECVHIHADVANKLLVSGMACRMAKTKKIILHSHASGVDGKNRWMKQIFHRLCRKALKHIATDFVSCSDLASQWMFPNVETEKIKKINNGINLDKFRYNHEKRQKIRKSLGLENNYVIGHVGRFAYQKNHEYLIDVFARVKKKLPSSKLLLVGEGDLQEQVRLQVESLGLTKDVIFYGVSHHVEELFQAMDIFVLPSHFEGLPIVGVEAQAAGLPVLLSSNITQETKLIDEVHFLPIMENHKDAWAENIVKVQLYRRRDTCEELKQRRFDIQQTMQDFKDLYTRKE